ncbi:MAG: hypothetical protein HUU01_06960 [Saprospiraceae bacterium]|nr:hypothetical protein [Saprospiraceae bacterium]
MNEKQPFAIQKHYTTPMTWREVAKILEGIKAEKRVFWKFQHDAYEVSVGNKRFTLQRNFDRRKGPLYPRVEGVVVSESPLVLDIKIIPNYWWAYVFLTLPVIFVLLALFYRGTDVNGLKELPELKERLISAFLSGGGLLFLGYVTWLKPFRETKQWLIHKLSLAECDPKL